MRKKINGRFMMIALYSIVMTTLVMTAVFYTQLQKQVFSDLQVVAQLLSNGGNLEKSDGSIRVTLIDRDGTVLFDSALDEQSLDNHKNRPEIEEAFAVGTGEGIRTRCLKACTTMPSGKTTGRCCVLERNLKACGQCFCQHFRWSWGLRYYCLSCVWCFPII